MLGVYAQSGEVAGFIHNDEGGFAAWGGDDRWLGPSDSFRFASFGVAVLAVREAFLRRTGRRAGYLTFDCDMPGSADAI